MLALRLFTRREVAAAFGVSPLRITKWTAAGMPVADRGQRGKQSRYDVAAVVAWRIETEVERRAPVVSSGGRAVAAGMNLGDERAKLARVQTRKAELEMRTREGELLETTDVVRLLALAVLAIRSGILRLPTTIAPALVACVQRGGGPPEVTALLRPACQDLLRELAAWTVPAGPPAEVVA